MFLAVHSKPGSAGLRSSLHILRYHSFCVSLQPKEPPAPEPEPMDEPEAEDSPESEVGMCSSPNEVVT